MPLKIIIDFNTLRFKAYNDEQKEELQKFAALQLAASRSDLNSSQITVIPRPREFRNPQLLLRIIKPTLIFEKEGRFEGEISHHRVAKCEITRLTFLITRFTPEQLDFVRKNGFPPYDAYFGIPSNPVRSHLISLTSKTQKSKLAKQCKILIKSFRKVSC